MDPTPPHPATGVHARIEPSGDLAGKRPRRPEGPAGKSGGTSTRAIVWTRYGPPEGLQLADVPKPTPKDDELLIRIRATTVTAGDCELRGLSFSIGLRLLVRMLMGLSKPRRKILGQELARDVEAIGKGVHRLRAGDPIFGTTGLRFGAYAEYICLPEDARGGAVAIKPANMDYDEAAAVPTGGLEALHFLPKARNLRGRTVLIHGAGGGIGTYAVQLAKYFGADVTGVGRSEKMDLMRSIGADRVIDYTREEFAPGKATYDVILDLVGKSSFSTSMRALKENGEYLLAESEPLGQGPRSRGLPERRKEGPVPARGPTVGGPGLPEGAHRGGRIRSVIDRRYSLEDIPAAHRYLGSGMARGKVVIMVDPGSAS